MSMVEVTVKQYAWRPGMWHPVSAQQFGEVIDSMMEHNEGVVTPHHVVEIAHNPMSPIHEMFEWDNEVAGHKWRVWQAREAIGSVMVVQTTSDKPETIRAYISVRGQEGRAYMSTVHVLSNMELAQSVLEEARKELAVFRDKYQQYSQLHEVLTAIESFLK